MDEHPQEWWDVSTDQNSTMRFNEMAKNEIVARMAKNEIVARMRALARGQTIDPILELATINGNPCGLDVRRVDAWALSTPATRERNRCMGDAADDEADVHDREHQRGKYKPKQWTPENDDE
jgi:hypothetical protein